MKQSADFPYSMNKNCKLILYRMKYKVKYGYLFMHLRHNTFPIVIF